MEPLQTWWATELYPSKDDENFGVAGDFEMVKAADAQATIAALQAMNNRLGVRVETLESQLTQRTAELEAAKRERDEAAKDRDDWITSWRALQRHNERIEAELERVRGQYAELGKMVLALPKVEGAVVVSNGYVKDSTRCHALFGADEDAALYAALLQHRQGMEG